MLFGGVLVIFLSFGLKRLKNNLKLNLSVLFFTICISVYGFETFLEFFKGEKPQMLVTQKEIIAKQMGVPYDTRTKIEVIDELRDSGIYAFPNLRPSFFVPSDGLTSNKGRIYPLGTISNSITILGNEAGYFPIIETDEYGFNNPKGLYNKNKVDIMLTGDSFVEGYSVNSNESISAVLRQLDFNTISIGKGGNGPLLEFAALKEYAKPLEPKIVLWVYYINDFSELENEMKSSLLKNYLNEKNYSQNLISRQEEIDVLLKKYAQIEWEKIKNKEKKKNANWKTNINKMIINNRIVKIFKLSELRKMIKPRSKIINNFRDILKKSNQIVSGWNAKMYFVYLPDYTRYSTGNEHPERDLVIKSVTELDIPVIDIQEEVFDSHPDPLSLFALREHNHYNAEGYKLVAEAIEKQLEADGYISIKSKK